MRIAVGNENTWKGISVPKPLDVGHAMAYDAHVEIVFRPVTWDVLRKARLTKYYVIDGSGRPVFTNELDREFKVKQGSTFTLENISWITPPSDDYPGTPALV